MIQSPPEKPGQRAAFQRGEDLSDSITVSWHTAADQATQLWPCFFSPLAFVLGAIAFVKVYFTSTQSSPCPPSVVCSPLASKPNLEIGQYWEVQRPTWFTRTVHCRLVLALIFPGNAGPHHSQGHLQEAQGVLTHQSCYTHTLNPVLPNVPDTLGATTHPQNGSTGCRAQLGKASPYRPSLN